MCAGWRIVLIITIWCIFTSMANPKLYVPCNIGVRQGDNPSPLLLVLFINDFSHYVGRSYKWLCVSKSCYPSLESNDALF